MAERPAGHQVPVGDEGGAEPSARPCGPPPPEPSHAERCRTLVASASRGALSTLAADPEGYPYGSVASYGLDDRGNPLLFVSLMAEHTQNAMRDPRASLLVTEPVPEGADPLASGRVTLLGLLSTVAEDDRPTARDRYLEANPTAAYYIDFGDFVFYRLDVQSIRYVGGYGRMSWVDAGTYAEAEPDPLAAAAAGIIEHMNARPCRRAGAVLPSSRRSSRHHRGGHVQRGPLWLRDDRGQPCGSCGPPSRLPRGVHHRGTGPAGDGRHGRRCPSRRRTRAHVAKPLTLVGAATQSRRYGMHRRQAISGRP